MVFLNILVKKFYSFIYKIIKQDLTITAKKMHTFTL